MKIKLRHFYQIQRRNKILRNLFHIQTKKTLKKTKTFFQIRTDSKGKTEIKKR